MTKPLTKQEFNSKPKVSKSEQYLKNNKPPLNFMFYTRKEIIDYCLTSLRLRLGYTQDQRDLFLDMITYTENFLKIKKDEQEKKEAQKKPIFLKDYEQKVVIQLIKQYNQADGPEAFRCFQKIMKYLELRIQTTNMDETVPELKDILNSIKEKDSFINSISSIAYSRGGKMAFPYFIQRHLA